MRNGLCLKQAARIVHRAPYRIPTPAPIPSTGALPAEPLPRDRPRPEKLPNYFTGLRKILNDPREAHTPPSVNDRLDAIHPSAFEPLPTPWPKFAVLGALTGPADLPSLIRILPVVLHFIEVRNVDAAAQVTRRMLRRLRRARVLPLVPMVMDAMLYRLRKAAANGEAGTDELMEVIVVVLQGLQQFSKFSSIKGGDERGAANNLPPTVNDEIIRLAKLAIDLAESSPSSSSSPSIISDELRARLFTRVLWTPELRRLLLSHIPAQDLTPEEWRACSYSVLGEGGRGVAERAGKFVIMSQKAEARVEKGKAKGNPKGRSPRPQRKVISLVETQTTADVLDAVDEITLARCGGTAQSLIQSLEPYLDVQPLDELDADTSPTRPYAWSVLLNRLSTSSHTSSADLLDVTQALAEDLTIPHIITPIITGLVARGDLDQAWALFLDLFEKQKLPGVLPSQYVDRQLLAAVTPLCAQLFGLPAAVQLVDDWARRPSTKPSDNWQHSIIIDTVNLNVLLTQYIHSGRPSVPLRLLAAAQPRWGVWPDDVSLNIILDCCRFSQKTEIDEPDTIRSRLRDLVGGILESTESPSTSHPIPFDIPSLTTDDSHVLLDPPEATWRQMMGDLRPWQYARQIFRYVIFGNWPHLINIHSPLEFGPFARLEDILLPYDLPLPGELRHPSPDARYTYLIPTPATFQSYITLLGFYNLVEEIPTALSWARELGLEPNWRSMCSALAYVGEVEGPRRRVRGWHEDGGSAFVRDEDILRRWLEEWVKGRVPTESDVAAFVRHTRDKGGKLSAGSRWGIDP